MHNLKKNNAKIKKKIQGMMRKKLDLDMNHSETTALQKAYGEELLSVTESMEERIKKLETTNIEARNERGLGEMMGELIHITTGVPGPTQYRQEIEAFAKITSIVDLLTLNQGQISHEIDTIMEIDHKQMEATKIISKEVTLLHTEAIYANDLHIFRSSTLKVQRNLKNAIGNAEKRVEAGKHGMICEEMLDREQLRKHTNEIKRKKKDCRQRL